MYLLEKNPFVTKMQAFEKILNQLLPASMHPLFEAANYAIFGGKYLRPRLTFALLEIFEQPIERGLYPAAGLEMIHAYSLIHDDLPCMDNDDYRRGKPSLHKAFGESCAVLTGDLLLTLAFETLAHAPHLTDNERLKTISLLSKAAGVKGMIGGQHLDLTCHDPDLATYKEMHLKKTGALITVALEFGALLSGEEPARIAPLGNALGLAYQVADDLLDEDGIVTLLGKEKAQYLLKDLCEEVFSHLNALPNGAPKLQTLCQQMLYHEKTAV
jgi:geranylgeranyl diphosphate synthase, type II